MQAYKECDIYSALHKYWKSKDKIALLAVESFANMIKRWIWDKTTECHIVLLGDSTHTCFTKLKWTALLEFIPLIDVSIRTGTVKHKADITDYKLLFSFRSLVHNHSSESGTHMLETLLRDFGHIVMIASHSCCRFVVCTSMMWISRSTASQRCSIGLRSGDCGGHLSKVNSLSCSRNQSEMIWALWHGVLSCWKYIRRWYTVVIKGWTWSETILR